VFTYFISTKIYENLLKNCVKTKRLDVALLCLAKMKEARIAREVRNTMEKESELDSHVAMLATQIDMLV
jgi:intraflagellar transport protein 140